MPAFGDIEKKEIGAIVQVIVKPVLRREGDGGIHGTMVQDTPDMCILIGKYEFGMIEIDLESPASLFIQEESQPVVILGDGQRLGEQALVPSGMVVPPDVLERIVIPQGRLGYVHAAMGVPFFVISPGKIYLLDKMILFHLLLCEAAEGDQGNEQHGGQAEAQPFFILSHKLYLFRKGLCFGCEIS
jgi:hypothetical protein